LIEFKDKAILQIMGSVFSRKKRREEKRNKEVERLNTELEAEIQRMRRKVKQLDDVIYLASIKLENARYE